MPTVARHPTTLGTLVTAGIDKASALTCPHRTQFAVHAPPVVVAVDPAPRLLGGGDEVAQQRIVHLLARIRRVSA
ncbi:hypothetical protein ACFV0D_22305 [Streptomyces sp. NPDC059556]|uniref:hypothetical protein n=1 Tax=Streptomyces sp. NPDC059556 TaxID=3346863 RepID=UPI0036B975ED